MTTIIIMRGLPYKNKIDQKTQRKESLGFSFEKQQDLKSSLQIARLCYNNHNNFQWELIEG